MKVIQYAFTIFICILPVLSWAALKNTNREISKIDLTKNHVVVWIAGEELVSPPPDDCKQPNAVACNVGEKFCDVMASIALSAKLSGKKIEFNFENECSGPYGEASRFRMMD